MIEIAETPEYTLKVDRAKNRIYLTIRRDWDERAPAPRYLNDVRKALRETSPGFTILTDVSGARYVSRGASDLHIQVHRLIADAGVSRAAEVISENLSSKARSYRFSKVSGLEVKRTFATVAEAEEWLDEG